MPQRSDVLMDLGPDLALGLGPGCLPGFGGVQLVACLESEPGGKTCAKIQVG